MKLLRVHVIQADTCGGLLDGLDVWNTSMHLEHHARTWTIILRAVAIRLRRQTFEIYPRWE